MRKMSSYHVGRFFFLFSLLLAISVASTGYARTYTFTAIDFPGATNTYLCGINNTGDIVGHYEDGNFDGHGFLYAKGIFTPIVVPGSPGTYPVGVNDSGDEVLSIGV